MKQFLHAFLLFAFSQFIYSQEIHAQDSTRLFNKVIHFPEKVFKSVDAKAEAINNRLMSQSTKYLRRMSNTERKMRKKISRKDSAAAEKIFGDAEKQYVLLQQKIKNVSGKTIPLSRKYLPHLDSLQSAFKFIDKTEDLLNKDPKTEQALKNALNKMDLLQDKFSEVENIKRYMKQRKQLLQDQLGIFGLTKDLQKLRKQVYYYQAQMNEYKEAFENTSQLESKALAILQKTSLFRNFFRQHSQLAGLFRLPDVSAGNPLAAFAGLHTRQYMQQQLLQRFGSLPDIQQIARQQGQAAASPFNLLKNKMHNLNAENGDPEMPDFKANTQKTKIFKKRLEFGTNLQTVKGNNFFPSTTDMALSVGYKLNDKSIIGIGSSYKMGWGKDIRHITISHQGIGLRSFMDYKIKGGFWLSGGAEMNYRSQFSNFEILNDYTPWQKSALLGFSKKYKVSKKVRGNMQLLYDFLYKEQIPRTPPLLFRVGYTIK
ncbi:MAG: hypothetical protein ABIN89_19475 [Chitinophagaceae bacterium]